MSKNIFRDLDTHCGGSGWLECSCGGDQCYCQLHGGLPCDGCPDCAAGDDAEDWDHPEPKAMASTAQPNEPRRQPPPQPTMLPGLTADPNAAAATPYPTMHPGPASTDDTPATYHRQP